MIVRGVFANPYCFTNHAPSQAELMELLKMHLDLYEKYANRPSRSIRDNGSDFRSEPLGRGRERESDEKAHLRVLPYEPLKHFFKIYVNNFPGAKDLRAKLMETHSVTEARVIINQ